MSDAGHAAVDAHRCRPCGGSDDARPARTLELTTLATRVAPPLYFCAAPVLTAGAHRHVHPLALLADEGQVFDTTLVGTAEPVRNAGIELRNLARHRGEIVGTRHEPKPPAQHVEPLVALVHARSGLTRTSFDAAITCLKAAIADGWWLRGKVVTPHRWDPRVRTRESATGCGVTRSSRVRWWAREIGNSGSSVVLRWPDSRRECSCATATAPRIRHRPGGSCPR
jgi:hypothetical protein